MEKVEKLRDMRIVRTYLTVSIAFGVLIGSAFPLYAGFFVEYRSGTHKLAFICGCVGAGILVGFFSFLIGRFTVLRFIVNMAKKLEILAAREADLNEDIQLHSSDCVGRLAGAFNSFQAKLRGTVSRLDSVSDKSRMIGLELAANSTQTSASSEQIARHMDLINEQTRLLLQEVDSVDDARMVINEASKLVSDNIDRQSDSLTSLSALIEDSVISVRSVSADTGEKIVGIRDIVALSQGGVADIAQVSKKCGISTRRSLRSARISIRSTTLPNVLRYSA